MIPAAQLVPAPRRHAHIANYDAANEDLKYAFEAKCPRCVQALPAAGSFWGLAALPSVHFRPFGPV
ncbi:MAG: hypothetical protein R3B13_22070 [Polyangiaceae bacterium]